MNLDERKQKILRTIVHEHVRTAEPVASDQIVAAIKLGVRSATIRNEMAEMAELGFLQQPHTSAGRIPSDLGYRFYVDRLMVRSRDNVSSPSITNVQQMRGQSAVDDLIAATCHLLSALTHLTALATAPTSERLNLNWIELRQVSTEKMMVLTLWSSGQLRHAIVDSENVSTKALQAVGRKLSDYLVGRTVNELCQLNAEFLQTQSTQAAKFKQTLVDIIRQIASDVICPEIFIDGTSWFARQPEFHDKSTIESVLSVFEQHDTLAKLLLAAAVGDQPQVIIGRENPLEPLRSCSLVAATYRTSSGVQGSLGVCGPTRMDYSGITCAVKYTAQNLSRALGAMLPS